MSILRITTRRLLCATSVVLLASCGKDSTGPHDSTGTLTQAEAQQMATALFEEVADALGNIGFSRTDFLKAGGAPIAFSKAAFTRAALSRGDLAHAGEAYAASTPTTTGSVNQPCTNGGRIVGTMTVNDNTNDAGTGTVTGSVTVTPQGCIVLAGTKRIAVDGDASLNYAFTMGFTRGQQTSDFVWRATGGIRWTGGGACAVNYTITITPRGTGSMSGTVCGERIDESF